MSYIVPDTQVKKSNARETELDNFKGAMAIIGGLFLLISGGYIVIFDGVGSLRQKNKVAGGIKITWGVLIAISSVLYFMVGSPWIDWGIKSVVIENFCYATNPDGTKGEQIACE